MQQDAQLIRFEAMTRGAIGLQVQFVIFDFVFRLTAST